MYDTGTNSTIYKARNKPDNFSFIIGAMKSGTTSLFEILSQHPQICPSRIKEPDYFTNDGDTSSLEKYLSLWDWHDDTHSIAMESSVAYTKAPSIPDVPKRIFRSKLGRYRFIYMLRNPLTRIESQVRHGIFAGWGDSLDAGIPLDAVSISSYAMQLDKYLEYFPLDNFMLVTLEEFKLNPQTTLSRICQFLDIDKDFQFKDVDKRRNSGEFFNSSSSISSITQSNLGQYIAHKVLPAIIKTWLRNFIVKINKKREDTSSMGRWKLTLNERGLILDMLAEDLHRLESEFGVDIQKYWHIRTDIPDTT